MTKNDFDSWMKYHTAAFPSVGDWLKKHPETIRFWEMALADASVQDAKAATDEMVSGTLEEPKGYTSHPRSIAKRAREISLGRKSSLRVVDGEPVYGCSLCLDEGYVPVVDPVHFRDGTFRPCYVLCTCSTGNRKANHRPDGSGKRRETPRYDRAKMFALDPELTGAQLKRDFQSWLNGGRVKELPGYESEFDAYNAAG